MTVLSYRRYRSPIGDLLLAATPKGLCRIEFDADAGVRWLTQRHELVEDPKATDAAATALDAYFAGRRPNFDIEVDLSHASAFAARVLRPLRKIPYGEVTTYGRLAAAAKTSPRAVGGAVGSNPLPIVIPCHRVIAADGSLGGFSGGLERKRALLALEGREGLEGGWEPRRDRRRNGVQV